MTDDVDREAEAAWKSERNFHREREAIVEMHHVGHCVDDHSAEDVHEGYVAGYRARAAEQAKPEHPKHCATVWCNRGEHEGAGCSSVPERRRLSYGALANSRSAWATMGETRQENERTQTPNRGLLRRCAIREHRGNIERQARPGEGARTVSDGLPPGWLVAGLRDAAAFAKRNPDVAQHVHDHPSGFMAPSPCPKDCKFCKAKERENG